MKALKALLFTLLFSAAAPALAADDGVDLLTGDTRLACEAVLCLSSGSRPSECSPSLRRYFDITHRKISDQINARRDFLNLCPASHKKDMPALINAIAEGAGRCDAEFLNRTNRHCGRGGSSGNYECRTYNIIPKYCKAYTGHGYTDIKLPRYVCTQAWGNYCRDGKFVD